MPTCGCGPSRALSCFCWEPLSTLYCYQGLERREWLFDNCDGLEPLREAMATLDMDAAVEESGVSRDQIDRAVRIYGPAEPSAIVYGLDNVPEDLHRGCVHSLAALALLTGNMLVRPPLEFIPCARELTARVRGTWDAFLISCLATSQCLTPTAVAGWSRSGTAKLPRSLAWDWDVFFRRPRRAE